jgi:N-acetylmuramoyl-L-alanine amidase
VEIAQHEFVGVKKSRALAVGEVIEPWLLVLHYTANQSAAGTVSWFQSPQSKVSAHLVVDFSGGLTQMVPFNRRANHAGKSRWRDKEGCNAFSIGIEIVNPGPLRRRTDGSFVDFNGKGWEGKVVEARHKNGNADFRFWAEYTEEQVGTVRAACQALAREYGIREIVGHDDIAPTRKLDPGPAFPLQLLSSIASPRDEDGGDVYAATTVLNVRSGAGEEFAKVEGSPLQPNQRVQVIEVNGTWWHVRTPNAELEGWVASHFLRSV